MAGFEVTPYGRFCLTPEGKGILPISPGYLLFDGMEISEAAYQELVDEKIMLHQRKTAKV
jgi:hypothetical protein